jgi:hypothetical protein
VTKHAQQLLPFKKYNILIYKQRALEFIRFMQYDILASVLGEKTIVKFAEKAKEQLLWLEMQFKNIILNQTTEQQQQEEEME